MTESRQHVWVLYRSAPEHVAHKLLIAARKAIATEPGTVPEVWPLYTCSDAASIAAEHASAGIWGTHQQGEPHQVHAGTTEDRPYPLDFGGACRKLFDATFSGDPKIKSPLDTFAEDSVSKRLAVLSRTDEVPVATSHITSLVRLMRSTGVPIAFNYTDLFWALRNWSDPDKRTAVLYRWSRSYFDVPVKRPRKSTTTTGARGK
jgi:CRISPR type I-E-associated protein CasB/Cse2